MISNFQVCQKTKRPACCDFFCCGNKFGRIERSQYAKHHGRINRIVLTRRYAKHVEKRMWRNEIEQQMEDFYALDEDFYDWE